MPSKSEFEKQKGDSYLTGGQKPQPHAHKQARGLPDFNSQTKKGTSTPFSYPDQNQRKMLCLQFLLVYFFSSESPRASAPLIPKKNEGRQNVCQQISDLGAPGNCTPFQPLLLCGFQVFSFTVRQGKSKPGWLWSLSVRFHKSLLLVLPIFLPQRVNFSQRTQGNTRLFSPWAQHLMSPDLLRIHGKSYLPSSLFLCLDNSLSRAILERRTFCFQQRAVKREIKIMAI